MRAIGVLLQRGNVEFLQLPRFLRSHHVSFLMDPYLSHGILRRSILSQIKLLEFLGPHSIEFVHCEKYVLHVDGDGSVFSTSLFAIKDREPYALRTYPDEADFEIDPLITYGQGAVGRIERIV